MSDTNTPREPNQWPGRDAGTDPNSTAPIGPPPPGAPVGLVEPPDPAPYEDVDWQGKYESERTRSRIFMAATAVASALLVGSLFYASAQGGSTGDLTEQQVPGMGPQSGMDSQRGWGDSDSDLSDQGLSGPGMGGPGMGGPGMGIPLGTVEQFFAADGSLNTEAVEAFKDQLEAAGTNSTLLEQQLAAQIESDVTRGHITQKQADELTTALGLEASGTSGTGA